MTRKKKVVKSPEEVLQDKLNREIEELQRSLHIIPTPQNCLKIGDEVTIGNLEDAHIEEVLEDGRIYMINFTKVDNNYGNSIVHKNQKRYVKWVDVRLKNENKKTLVKNEDLRLNYSQRELGDILSKAYYFGTDFEPDYQRDYVWELQDKIELIDSMFNNIDIGKFVFIKIDDEIWKENDYKYMYEILDGKQRIRAILDFYEDRFAYKGITFSELSRRDQRHFTSYSINIAEISDITEEQLLRYFLKLNVTGKTMDEKHLDKVKKKLNKIISG